MSGVQAQGTALHIGTGTGGAITITAISKAFNAEVTGTHTLTVGDRVTFATVGGMTQINGLTGTVRAVTSTTAFVVGIDSRAFTTYTSGGTATPVTWTEVLGIIDYSPSGATVSEIDTTDLKSTAKEFMAGLTDNGSFTINYKYLEDDAGQAACRVAGAGSLTKSFKITDPLSNVYTFSGHLSSYGAVPSAGVDQVLKGSQTVRISGAVVVS